MIHPSTNVTVKRSKIICDNKKLQYLKVGSLLLMFSLINGVVVYLIEKYMDNSGNVNGGVNPGIIISINIISVISISSVFYIAHALFNKIIKKRSNNILGIQPLSPKKRCANISNKMRNPLQEILFAMDLLQSDLQIESTKCIVVNAVTQLEIMANELLESSSESGNTLTQSPSGVGCLSGITKKLHILVVDDSAVNRAFLQSILTKLEHTVDTANDGQVAVDLICNSSNKKFDVIFMDINMPVMGGLEATRIIRAKFNSNVLPIIACTSNGSEVDLQNFKEAQMNGHVLKPINTIKINNALHNIFGNSTLENNSSNLLLQYSILRNTSIVQRSRSSEIDNSDKEQSKLHTPTLNTSTVLLAS